MAFEFVPSGARGARLDQEVRGKFADSLSTLAATIVAQRPEVDGPMNRCITGVRAGPVRPGLFALYSDLVESIFLDDQIAFASAVDAIVEFDAAPADGIRGLTMTDADLGAGMADRFLRHLDDDPTTPVSVLPLRDQEIVKVTDRLADTLSLLAAAAPELADEIRALIREIVFVESKLTPGGTVFHGASTFYLWGALFLNAAKHPDRVSMAEGLAHEAAHSLLLGYTLGAPLVDNDPSERFASPLRDDLRPMDGIVHATYVLARMYFCIERLLGSGFLDAAERDRLHETKRRRRAEYLSGLDVVSASARLTPIGTALLEGAKHYMAAA
jgi:HEXXH motif-containing protein